MTITPTGQPAWTRTASAETYGGHPDKVDYQSQGVVNPKTDVSAAQFSRLCADVAAVARMAPFSVITLTCNDSGTDDPTISSAFQMDVGLSTGYEGDAPPPGFPTITRVSNGKVQVVYPSTPSDDYSVSAALTTYHAQATVIGAAGFVTVNIAQINAVTWTFEAYSYGASSPVANASMTIEVC